jgi:hypothetical protein
MLLTWQEGANTFLSWQNGLPMWGRVMTPLRHAEMSYWSGREVSAPPHHAEMDFQHSRKVQEPSCHAEIGF